MNRRRALSASLGLAMTALAGCQPATPDSVTMTLPASDLVADLERVARARVLFAHQSVGRNVLEGTARLAAEAGVALKIVELRDGRFPEGPGVYHLNIGENGKPEGKLAAFRALLTGPARPTFDLAALKLCYVDLDGADDARARALAEHYLTGIAGLRAQRPDLKLLHLTMPVRDEIHGAKTLIKRLIGVDQTGDADNAARAAYNAVLRQRLTGQPLFDIARLESTRADGSRTVFTRRGVAVETLAPGYTSDGGHLNAAGQRHVAAAFLTALAAQLPR